MLPTYTVIFVLMAQIIVSLYLKPWRVIAPWLAAVRISRRITAFRCAGMLLILVAVAQGQRVETFKGDKRCPGCTGGVVYGVIHDQDYETARTIVAANNIRFIQQMGLSQGEDVVETQPKPDAFDQMVWNNWYWFVGAAVLIFGFLQYGGKESNDTDINDMLDPDYRTGFVKNYHGDDAFEVPEGMHSEHMPVPVRSRSASAGR